MGHFESKKGQKNLADFEIFEQMSTRRLRYFVFKYFFLYLLTYPENFQYLFAHISVQNAPLYSDSTEYQILKSIPCSSLNFNLSGTMYVILKSPMELSDWLVRLSPTMIYTIKDCDPNNGEPEHGSLQINISIKK